MKESYDKSKCYKNPSPDEGNPMVKFVISTLVLFSVASASTDDPFEPETCLTAVGQTGKCINYLGCPLFPSGPLSDESLQLRESLHCGYDFDGPMVCCPDNPAKFPAPPNVTGHRNLRLLDHDICSTTEVAAIFNGKKTHIFDIPWMALIAYEESNVFKYFKCSGTVLNTRYVLTAAHCLIYLPAGVSLCGVRLGVQDTTTPFDCNMDYSTAEYYSVDAYYDFLLDSYYSHPDYNRDKNHLHDIGLIRLSDDVQYDLGMRPICLPIGSAANIIGHEATVIRWGRTENGQDSPDLIKVDLSLVNHDECTAMWQSEAQLGFRQMCVGGKDGKSPCSGDSGGSLQSVSWYNDVPKYVQHGIVSFGPKCGDPKPDVFTRLAYYVDWVLENIQE